MYVLGTTTRLYRFNPGTGEQVTQKVVLDDIIFDWDNMLDEYNSGSYSEAQGKAVAELMLACGASVEMEYTPSGSGAMGSQACYALRTYFGRPLPPTNPLSSADNPQVEDMPLCSMVMTPKATSTSTGDGASVAATATSTLPL